MPHSAVCARSNRMSGEDDGHIDCAGSLRYLDAETGLYAEGRCECTCHVEKREWYLSDFGPPPHQILWIGTRQDLDSM
jgi:hypothetical protein